MKNVVKKYHINLVWHLILPCKMERWIESNKRPLPAGVKDFIDAAFKILHS